LIEERDAPVEFVCGDENEEEIEVKSGVDEVEIEGGGSGDIGSDI
jgi:hypothetical protein